jgi:hypothetical protein
MNHVNHKPGQKLTQQSREYNAVVSAEIYGILPILLIEETLYRTSGSCCRALEILSETLWTA